MWQVILAILVASGTHSMAAVYGFYVDFRDQSPGIGYVSFSGSITSSQDAVLTTEQEIINYMNSLSYNFVASVYSVGGELLHLNVNHSNSFWGLTLRSSMAVVETSATEMTIDFSTEGDSYLELRSPENDIILTFFQLASPDPMGGQTGVIAEGRAVSTNFSFPYDEPFRFAAIPEPSVSVFCLPGILLASGMRRRRILV